MNTWELLQQVEAYGNAKYEEGRQHGEAAASRALAEPEPDPEECM